MTDYSKNRMVKLDHRIQVAPKFGLQTPKEWMCLLVINVELTDKMCGRLLTRIGYSNCQKSKKKKKKKNDNTEWVYFHGR